MECLSFLESCSPDQVLGRAGADNEGKRDLHPEIRALFGKLDTQRRVSILRKGSALQGIIRKMALRK